MTRKIVPFVAEHLQDVQGAEGSGVELSPQQAAHLEKCNSYTVLGEGRPVACGGTILLWRGRYAMWATIDEHAKPHMLSVVRAAQLAISQCTGRVETSVEVGFEKGHRLVRLLGFEVETPLLRRYSEGRDHVGYVRFV